MARIYILKGTLKHSTSQPNILPNISVKDTNFRPLILWVSLKLQMALGISKTINLYGFASEVSPSEVKELLEQYTGDGSITSVKVIKPRDRGSRWQARVQFTVSESAKAIVFMADNRLLWHESSYLKARQLERDITPEAEDLLQSVNVATLYFGCMISRSKLFVLWKEANVTMKIGLKARKLFFFLSNPSVDYKMELYCDNIWQTELRCPLGQPKMFLLIQLLGAPRIYKKDVSVPSYFKNAGEGRWIRDVDFTPGSCIGQSSSLCLELSCSTDLSNLAKGALFYKKVDQDFILENGTPYSSNSEFAPMVTPPPGFCLPYNIFFKINSLVQSGCLPGPLLDESFYELVDPRKINIAYIEHALEKLFRLKECCYEPVVWLSEQYRRCHKSGRVPRPSTIALDEGLVYIRRVQVTPSKVYFSGPEVSLSNRVLRNYPDDIDNFIRVSFVDEELDKIHSTDLRQKEERYTRIYDRILSVLRNGIVIGDKKFEFLAFSSSQLRENSLWMFASRPGLTAASIREEMGELSEIRNVAKYSARLGQSFGSSRETVNVGRLEMEILSDIECTTSGNKYVFSDGIGKISAELAEIVAAKCGCSHTPSAFQIRYGGYKGVVAVDPTSSVKLSLRKSMLKFKSCSTSLDVLAWSRHQASFLNRQLITLMSTLGVKDEIFVKKQRDCIAHLNAIQTDPLKALEAVEWVSSWDISKILKEMLICGYKPDVEPFLSMVLQTFRASKLFDLRTRTRIFIQNGRSMLGCLDETGTLQYGQVFVQYSSESRPSQKSSIVKGKTVVAKNPCLHPGDMRVVEAVDVPALHHMVDCIVFPQKGHRPHPNECSGSDLDGDVYFVCWDKDLIPPRQFPAMDYTPAAPTLLEHDVTIEEVAQYFTDYIVDESLGKICNAHTVFSDRENEQAMSQPCLELAKRSSIAVDFAKTGVPAYLPPALHARIYPDFMEKIDKRMYESQRVIGKLFREVKDIARGCTSCATSSSREAAYESYDPDLEVDGFKKYLADAFDHKTEYDSKLANLMRYYGIETEGEIVSGCVMKMAKSFDPRSEVEQVALAVRALRKEARAWFNERTCDADLEGSDTNAKASAWYYVTYHPTFWGCYRDEAYREHFLSFPWCVYDKLLEIKRDKASLRRSLRLCTLKGS